MKREEIKTPVILHIFMLRTCKRCKRSACIRFLNSLDSNKKMETSIIEPNPSFDFAPLVLGRPSTSGGSFFAKIHYLNKPLYIQTPKSWTREGFVKMNKKITCDLMFDSNHEEFITWIELLETAVQNLIHQHSKEWFESQMEPSEIESFFKPSLKLYKSGKYYLLKTQIKTHALTHDPLIKIFSEDESILRMEDIQPSTSILSVLEIQGLKFTTRQFQIEYELKQVMVADVLFETCVIHKKTSLQKQIGQGTKTTLKTTEEEKEEKYLETESDMYEDSEKHAKHDLNFSQQNPKNIIETETELKDIKQLPTIGRNIVSLDSPTKSTSLIDLEQLSNDILSEIGKEKTPDDDLKEVADIDFKLEFDDNNSAPVQLKKPNQRAFEMYKEARKKAKEAKKQSLLAYLEAQQIKQTYLLEDIESSDSEDDYNEEDEE